MSYSGSSSSGDGAAPPPPPPPPFPIIPVQAPGANAPDTLPLALALIARNRSDIGNGPLRGSGFLDYRGTSGGVPERVARYLSYAAANGGTFPYWTLDAAAKALIHLGQSVTAQPGPHNTFGVQTPRGVVPFVVMLDGTLRIGPSLRIGMPVTTNHCYISQGALQVAYAGEMRFGGVMRETADEPTVAAGVLMSWTNNSGGYRCAGNDAARVGLPMNLYRGTPSAPNHDRVDTLVRGVGGRINWGRHGAPQTIRTQQQDYWTR